MEPSEWDLAHAYLRAPGASMAVMEVASAANAASVAAEVRAFVGDESVYVLQPDDISEFRDILEWIHERDQPGNVLLIGGLVPYTRSREGSRRFWTWAEQQRERWPGTHAKVVFVLLSGQVDDFQRFAPMLWDWIPGHFDLRERADEALMVESIMNTSGDANAMRELVPVLRAQLRHAREQKLPDEAIRERYALPLFDALVSLGDMDQARAVLSTELGADFAERMSGPRAALGWISLGLFHRRVHDLSAAEAAFQAAAAAFRALGALQLAVYAEGELGQIVLLRGEHERAEELFTRAYEMAEQSRDADRAAEYSSHLGQIALDQGEHDVAEDAFLRVLERARESGDQSMIAHGYRDLSALARARGDHANAEDWLRKELRIREELGDESNLWGTYCALGQLALDRGDAAAAEPLLYKALGIAESLGLPGDTARVESELGQAAAMQGRWHDAATHLLNALAFYRRASLADDVRRITHNYHLICTLTDAEDRAHLIRLWRDTGLDPDDIA